ncbi:MAG TPA: putative Ig domain-containing protein, partial [Clostridia bacterium]|nr:putative Ig domain-containing protein [Clostridia bacterium]
GGRAAWSGNSGGYVMTVLRLPQTAAGQTVQLRWRSASDAASNQAGWWIDTVNLKSRVCCENAAPVLGVQPDMAGTELALLQVTNSVVFAGSPPGPFGYALLNPPTGASIDAQGVITWVPAENQGPGTYVVTTVVVNESAPHLKATNTFQVTVEEANSAPVLPVLADTSIPEAIELVITNTALDLDLPANTLAYQLSQAPAGAVIGADGVIRWTPGEFDGGGTFSFTTVVTDEGMPAQSSTNSFVVTVEEVNSAPILPKLPNRTVVITTELIVTNAGVDPDFPANALAYILETGPAGATIDPQGVIFWTPSEQTGTGVYAFTTVVVDDGVPAMSATNTFAVTVIDTNLPPVLPVHEPLSIVETSQLTITNTATDPDGSAGALVYTLLAAPAGALIDTSGIISWQPGEEQGPSEHAFITKVTDAGVPPRSATNQFVVTVLESNLPPVLPVQTNLTVAEHALVVLTNSAADTDLPSNTLTYVLETAPGGAVIDAHGVITWEAAEEHGPGTHVFTTVVIDNGSPALTATNSFTVTVTEINEAPVLPAQPGRVVAEMSRMWVTNTAADPDLPANALVYNLQSAPAGASIDGEGVISWEPTEQQGPGVHTFVIVVLDERGLSATNAFEVTVVESNQPPLMPVQSDRTVLEMTQVMITNTATDLDEPKNGVRYVLQSGPAGASIDLNGVLSWEPAEFQGPGVHTFTLVAVDNGEPALSTTNTFTITVLESNRAPVLPFQPDLVVEELATMQVTNRAVDFDLPLNLLTYALVQAPPGALLSPNGIITWTPAAGQGGSTNEFMLVVTDSGGPSMSATNSFLVVVPGTAQSLEITGFQITGGTASLSWNSAIGQTYRVQYCNPLGGTWQDASADLGADQAVTTVTIPISNPSGFYRVIKLEAGSAPAMGAQFSN